MNDGIKKRGKLIVIAGTDCSGKETQSKLLVELMKINNIPVKLISFPRYNTPTGKIIGGPYLGKESICESWFENPVDVDSKIASLYYAADRLAAKKEIISLLDEGVNVILDRYVSANMGHQGAKLENYRDRKELYKWLEDLEYGLLRLPIPDETIFLHMPTDAAVELRQCREEKADGHECDQTHLKAAENAYLELAELYRWTKIECVDADYEIKPIYEIHNEIVDALDL